MSPGTPPDPSPESNDASTGSDEERPPATDIGPGQRSFLVADIEPLDIDGIRTVEVGTGLWLVAFLALLPFYERLQDGDRLWWLWTCLAGFGLGLVGLEYCRRHRRRRHDG